MIIASTIEAYIDSTKKVVNHSIGATVGISLAVIIPIVYYTFQLDVNPLNYWDNIIGFTFVNLTIRMIAFPLIYNRFKDFPTWYIGKTSTIDKILGNLYWFVAIIFLFISIMFYLFLSV